MSWLFQPEIAVFSTRTSEGNGIHLGMEVQGEIAIYLGIIKKKHLKENMEKMRNKCTC